MIIAALGLLVVVLAVVQRQHRRENQAVPAPSPAPATPAPTPVVDSPLVVREALADSVDPKSHTFTYAAAEVFNLSTAPLLVDYPFVLTGEGSRAARVEGVLAAPNVQYLSGLAGAPPRLSVVEPGQVVTLWLRVHIDCSAAAAAGLSAGDLRVVIPVRGYPGPASFRLADLDSPTAVGVRQREACAAA